MKKRHLEASLLILFLCWKLQLSMSRHHRSHPHHEGGVVASCRRCAPGWGVTRPCTRHRDTECAPCRPGRTYSSTWSPMRPCYPCSRCGPGLYVAHPCTARADTVCDSCHTYRGPHNRDFRERCADALASRRNAAAHATLGETVQELHEAGSSVAASVVLFSGVALGAVTVALVAACLVVSRRRNYCKKVDPRYEAVATQEAVVL